MPSKLKFGEKEVVLLDHQTTKEFIDKLDGQLFMIKNWALVTSTAVIAYGVSQKMVSILFVNVFVVLSFGFLELIYKTFHETGMKRAVLLEKIIHKSMKSGQSFKGDYVFGLGSALEAPTLNSIFKILTNPNRWHLRMYYLMLVFFSISAGVFVYVLQGAK